MRTAKLGDLCEFKPSKRLARVGLSENDPVSFVPMSDLGIHEKYLKVGDERPLSEVAGSYTYFADGDILLAKITPCFENGKLGIARGLTNGVGFGSSEFTVIRPGSDVLAEYIYYFLDRDEVREGGAKVMTGAVGHKRVPQEFVEALEIPLPPLDEQRRIVAVLDEAFAAITTATTSAEKNLASAKALFQSILSEVLQDVARKWKSHDLQSLVIEGRKISYGIVKPGRHDPLGVRLIKSQQVRENSMDLSADFRITRALDKEYARTRLQGGEILLNLVGASIGRSAIAPDQLRGANVSRAIAVIPVRAESAPWVQYNLRASVGQELIRSKTGGSAQPVLNLSEVKRLPISLPPLAEQEAIVRRLDALSLETQRLERSYRRKIEAFDEFKQSLLHRAFSGELTEREPLAA